MYNKKIINIFFFIILISLCFNTIPTILRMNFIGSSILSSKLVFYPLIIGTFYTLYCQYKHGCFFKNFKIFSKYILVYMTIIIISLLFGLMNYPYYDLVLNGPIMQIDKLPKVISSLNKLGIYIDVNILIAFWMVARIVKSVLLEITYTFGGAYMIYCWYHNNWQTAFKILIKAVLASLVIIFGYCFIELFYLAGNENAKNILISITPYFHSIKTNHDWWPPLLWAKQLRSIFAEPSYYGIYSAFAMPFLWYVFFEIKKSALKVFILTSITFLTFGLFLTQARTAVALFIGELFLFAIAILILRNKAVFFKFVAVSLCSMFAFGVCNVFISNYLPIKVAATDKIINNQVKQKKYNNSIKQHNENNKSQVKERVISKKVHKDTINQKNNDNILNKKQIDAYFEKNLFSLGNLTQRSNGARYSIMLTDFKIGLDHPIIGVGSGLRNAYIPDYLPEMAKNNGEVKMWIKNQKEKGILRSGFPKLGEYTSRFAETGIIGLALFLILPFILLRKLYFKIADKSITVEDKLPYVFFTISLIGIMASGLGDTINITYCYWVLLGLGYAMCFGKENDVKDNGDTGSRQEH